MAGRVATMNDWSPAEVGGLLAAGLGVLAALGKALAWLMSWGSGRADARAKQLQAWEASLDRREKEQRERTEGRLAALEVDVKRLRVYAGALRNAFAEVTVQLQTIEPANPALGRAAAMLKRAIPYEQDLPEDVLELARMLDDN